MAVEYRLFVSIDREDEPKFSKHGNPILRFSCTWGLAAYEDNVRKKDRDRTWSSDGCLLTISAKTGNITWAPGTGWGNLHLNRPSPLLEEDILEELKSGGYVKKLRKFSENNTWKKI